MERRETTCDQSARPKGEPRLTDRNQTKLLGLGLISMDKKIG